MQCGHFLICKCELLSFIITENNIDQLLNIGYRNHISNIANFHIDFIVSLVYLSTKIINIHVLYQKFYSAQRKTKKIIELSIRIILWFELI